MPLEANCIKNLELSAMQHRIKLHRPHPGNVLKRYQIDLILQKLKYKGFIGSEHCSAEDRVFYGKVEGVNDLISFEGSTVDEPEEGCQYMVDKHLEDCEKKDIPLLVHRLFYKIF